jgi:D-tyrosyl-tRNA(Tyr) deacylase
MRAVVQRVSHASISEDGQVIGQIGRGLVVLVGAGPQDDESDARLLATKIANLRIFDDAAGKMNLSVLDVGGQALAVSQFTLYADTHAGRRPSFTGAAPPELAAPLIQCFCDHLRATGLSVATGRFAAMMMVEIHNDGPVTLLLDTADWRKPA